MDSLMKNIDDALKQMDGLAMPEQPPAEDEVQEEVDENDDTADPQDEEVVEDENSDDDTGDEPDGEPEDTSEPETEGEEPPADQPENQAVNQINQRVEQLVQGFNQLIGYVQHLQGQIQQQGQVQAPTGQRQPEVVQPDTEVDVPDNIEEYTQREAVSFALKKARAAAQAEIQKLQQPLGIQSQIFGEILGKLIEAHPEKAVIRQALDTMKTNRIPFSQAFEMVKGKLAQQENERLLKIQQNRDRSLAKKKGKAIRQSQKPTPSIRTQKQLRSIREITDSVLRGIK